MFTQCPECSIAFRVTAKILQQANGNVRCGGCNHAFNALHYLSEEMPTTPDQATGNTDSDKLAETSRRLLETLDELAGPDEVHIEDTGIEWRVLDNIDADAADDEAGEMRYDDSTPLPDDFGVDSDEEGPSPHASRSASDRPVLEFIESNDLQGELLLSEPEDWTDLLDEVSDLAESDALEVEEELAAIHNQLSAQEESSELDAGPAELSSQSDMQAEAMGLDILSPEDALTDEIPLLDEAGLSRLADMDGDDVEDDSVEESDVDAIPDDEDTELSGDFILQEDETDDEFHSIDDPMAQEIDSEHIEDGPDNEIEPEIADDAETDHDADGYGEISAVEFEDDEAVDEFDEGSLADQPDEEDGGEDEGASFPDRESTGEFESNIEKAARALSGEDEGDDDALADDEADESVVPLSLDGESTDDEDSAGSGHVVPEPTEEEMTVNMEIDQEMMALATKDDGFSATLFDVENAEDLFNENSGEVETIIMEGEFVRGSIERERLAAESAARSQFDDPASLVDTYALRRGKGRRKQDPAGYGVTIAVVLLALVLIGQFIHNSRESLATMGLFNQTIAPVYRMLGNPVTPSWDIRGWQFEATNGNVDESETALTIVSKIVNRSAQPLPYPLVHISLTDRWEDIMGTRILEPGEYLAGDLDPSSPVLPGENFTAVITIENPSAEATGFKLNVCYRVAAGTVRCAIEDFKN